jgi:hypothetical protein
MASGDNACIPFFEPGDRPTGKCSALVRGSRLVSISDGPVGGMRGTENFEVKECDGATEVPVAVSGYEGAAGEQIPLIGLRSEMIVPCVAGAVDVVAGGLVMSDGQGRVIPFTGADADGIPGPIGVAVEDQATTDAEVGVWLI